MEDDGSLRTGDFVFDRRDSMRPQWGVVIAKKQANNGLLQNEKHQWVYYILTHEGRVEGPIFKGEIRELILEST